MFGLSIVEISLILLIVFLVFGPEELPGVIKKVVYFFSQAKQLMHQAQTSIQEVTHSIKRDLDPMNLQMGESFHSEDKVADADFQKSSTVAEPIIEEIDESVDSYEVDAYDIYSDEGIFENDKLGDYEPVDIKKI